MHTYLSFLLTSQVDDDSHDDDDDSVQIVAEGKKPPESWIYIFIYVFCFYIVLDD